MVHADLPSNSETLLHRSGRTGRAGKKGVSVLMVPHSRRRKAERLLAEAGDLPLGDEAGAALGAEADDEGESLPSSSGRRVTNVVFMGMGEALANYKAAIGAIRRMVDPSPEGLGMSARGITMSSVGLVTGIDRLTEEGIPVTLALSLHAPDDELRDELVPINTRFKVDEAIDAALVAVAEANWPGRSNSAACPPLTENARPSLAASTCPP